MTRRELLEQMVAAAQKRGQIFTLTQTGIAIIDPPFACVHGVHENEKAYSWDDIGSLLKRYPGEKIIYAANKNLLGVIENYQGKGQPALVYSTDTCSPIWVPRGEDLVASMGV